MTILPREIYKDLLAWKVDLARKPLLIRGARQIGKTFIVREIGRTFPNFIEINFLENRNFQAIFEKGHFDIDQILSQIGGYFNTQIVDGQTLIFLDEVQVSPGVIEALRFFYEKRPNLHVIATGSLLEFALADLPSFGVGRIQNLFMRPLTFKEFLLSEGKTGLLENIRNASPTSPMPKLLHGACLELYKTFLLIGGMPEAVAAFISDRSLSRATNIVENIVFGYEDDFQKYRKHIPTDRLRETLRSSALQSGKKFVYRHAYLDAKSQSVHDALNLLVSAGLVYRVYHSDSNGIPLGAEVDLKRFKTLPLDIGIYQRLIGLRLKDLVTCDPTDLINKGALVENAVGQDLLGYFKPKMKAEIFYWHRESRSSNAEVDFVIEVAGRIVPIEVKASQKGSMQSLRLFLAEKKKNIGVRVSLENFSSYQCSSQGSGSDISSTIIVVPAYAVSEIGRVVE